MTASSNSEETIFNHAVGLPTAERSAYLDQACGGDEVLRARVDALLRAHDAAGDLLEAAPGGAVRAALAQPFPVEKPGTLIGRYKLLQKIGEGGCGVVYMAEQQEPVVRRVALKVIKLGMDTREVIARFEAERQALALMDHPNIARVFDGGATVQGRPFFVMELVRGIKITEYCDRHNLSTAERLHLFTQVCRAIDHAHAKGIVHRDIKPSNILVTMIDGTAVPKVIDFGIAKATQGHLTDRTLFTAFEQFIGTPAYMSPEQAEMSGVEIDARSDIYSLGVLLYELLTGCPPFDPQDLVQVGLDAMRRHIREVEPLRPSARLSTLEANVLSLTALHRSIAVSRLIHSVRGDLDWIAMKCLEKDRRRRYETAASLAEDVRRHLENQPVRARRPSLYYRGSKFARRHRSGLLLVGGVLAFGVLGWKLWPVATVATTPPRNAAVAPNLVGPRGNPNTIDITGTRDFSAGAIREGLGHDDSFIQAAHSEAPLDELVAVTQQAILRGYRSLGYLHATVAATHNPDQARLKVVITEGRRYRRGEVQIIGLTPADSADVVQLLTKPPPSDEAERAEEAVTSFLRQQADIQHSMAQIESLLSNTPTGLRAASKVRPATNAQPEVFVTPSYRPRHALWERETSAPFTGDYLQEVVAELRLWLDRKGFPTAEIQAEVQPDETTGLASLQVRIQEGTRAVLGPVKVIGHQRNTAEEIIRCTGLTPGQNLDARAIARARLALWNSARFYEFSLRARATSPEGGVCAVEIDVNECDTMPPLRESLSRQQQALVRFANWVTTETRRREFKVTLGDPGISLVLTPEKGSAIYTEDPKTGALLALLIRPDGIRLFGTSDANSTGLDICRVGIRPTAFLHIFTTRGTERHGNINMGLGFSRELGPSNPHDPDGFAVVLAPLVASKDLAAHAVPTFADGDVILQIENEGRATTLRFREDTGALVSMDKLQLKEIEVSFQVGGNDFARVTQRADQEWSRLPFDPAQRMSLAELLLQANLRKHFTKTEVTPPDLFKAAIFLRVSERLLATPEFQTWLNPASLRNDPPFIIPGDIRHGMPTGDLMASLGRTLHQFTQVFAPSQTWPARLMREIPYLIEGHTEHSAAMFNDLSQDPDMGPIGSLLTAKLMLQFNQPGAWRFACRAVNHGSVEEFRRDYHNLLEGDSTVGRMIQTALPALASMSNEETEQIIAGWPEAEAKFWRRAMSLFREMKSEGVVAALRPELESWWTNEIQPHLSERIGRFLEPGEPIPALVAATVNGRVIRRSVLAAVRRNPRLLTAVPPEIPPASAGPSGADQAFETLVLLTLVREEAIAHGADDSPAAIDRRLDQIIREQFHDDRKAFETMLEREGLRVDDFRQLTLLNDAYAGLLQSIGQPASTASPAIPGARAGSPGTAGQPDMERQRRTLEDHLRGLRTTAFVRTIPEPAQAPVR